jgi:hypothetical protein
MAKSSAAAANQQQRNLVEPKRLPVEKFHEGPVHVSIWENDGIKGTFRTASFELRYKKGDEWLSSYSYGLSDLKHLEAAAASARAHIQKWQQEKTQAHTAPKS